MSKLIKGFFFVKGSKDIPLNSVHTEKFGFEDSPEPLFKYSLLNIIDFFFKPLMTANMISNGNLQTLITEEINNPELKRISPEDFESKKYQVLFDALTDLYMDQENVGDIDDDFNNKGDRLLSENIKYSELYESGSLYIETIENEYYKRVSFVRFRFKINDEDTLIQVYFNPDTFISKYAFDIERYHITYTKDEKGNDIENLSKIITDKYTSLFQMEYRRNYTNVVSFETTHNIYNENDELEKSYIRKFFIHSNMYKKYNMPNYYRIVLIKKFLEAKYKTVIVDGYREILIKEYPELFTGYDVDIYPMLTDREYGRKTSTLPFNLIKSECERRDIAEDIESRSEYFEFFLLEGVGKYDDNEISLSKANRNFIVPLMAIYNGGDSLYGPITSNFSDYSTTYTGYERIGRKWEEFHFYLKLFVKLTIRILEWKYSDMTDSELSSFLNLPDSFQLSTERIKIYDEELVNSITFSFMGVTYTVHGFYKYYEVKHG